MMRDNNNNNNNMHNKRMKLYSPELCVGVECIGGGPWWGRGPPPLPPWVGESDRPPLPSEELPWRPCCRTRSTKAKRNRLYSNLRIGCPPKKFLCSIKSSSNVVCLGALYPFWTSVTFLWDRGTFLFWAPDSGIYFSTYIGTYTFFSLNLPPYHLNN